MRSLAQPVWCWTRWRPHIRRIERRRGPVSRYGKSASGLVLSVKLCRADGRPALDEGGAAGVWDRRRRTTSRPTPKGQNRIGRRRGASRRRRQKGAALEHEAIKIEWALGVMTYRSGKRGPPGRARYGASGRRSRDMRRRGHEEGCGERRRQPAPPGCQPSGQSDAQADRGRARD